jgi:protein SCO1
MRDMTRNLIFFSALVWLIAGCDRLSVKESLNGVRAELLDQEGNKTVFPDDFDGKTVLVGYLYTYCPDICPFITLHMKEVEEELDREDVHFVAITLDPPRDTPEVLADYARRFSLKKEKWTLLTGERDEVGRLLEELNIVSRRTPIRETDSGEPIYFIDHTDRVSLMDGEANLRRHSPGSEMDTAEVVADIRALLTR